jgi:hypothetical protein
VREPARSDSEARSRYLHFLNRSLQCVTSSAVWHAGKGADAEEWVAFTVPRVVELRRVGSPLYFSATQTFHYADHPDYPGERKVSTDEYAYTLGQDPDFRSEMFSWHWQPSPRGHPDPHLHVGYRMDGEPRSTKWHVPSGRVAFEQVLVFAINELGVETSGDRAEAMATLDDSLRRFRRYASWGVDSRPDDE